MIECNIKKYKIFILASILLVIGLSNSFITQGAWFEIIFKIRKAIEVGDSGILILAAASMSFLYAMQSTFLFLGSILIVYYGKCGMFFNKLEAFSISFVIVIFLHMISWLIFDIPWEPVTTIFSLIIALIAFQKLFFERNGFLHISIVSIQVFFAFQWLNIMPMFSPYYIGKSDIPCSIKIAGMYLKAESVLNFTGFAFFIPFIFSAFVTAALFISHIVNIKIIRENYKKENEIQSMKAKVLENRILKEVKSLVHDLKTPLVTIQGLNSLIAVTQNEKKLQEYSERIEGAASKMSEMISSFLYDTSKQKLHTSELISYIRAQLPLEDDSIKIDIKIADVLPYICVNKIRVARAVINILENAIVAPYKCTYKHIDFEVRSDDRGIYIIVKDNGIGIKESELKKIFEIGYSTNKTSGLGLPFAKQVIEDNEGTIEIISEVDKGTVVIVFLPEI
ncbi:GHKL domain-containing protein [Clostridiaceae bacterium UIB06]|uniref:histidine kinase n=1 Tax=Clostridium thailandense TaxID=2794346 RepID=A0A949WPY2_9CLOT|nr:HAMP domain-containing sensor histidine kinase [Clostridium thailandense]MBV7272001.1 GHKL domain-containing protein [Clostridium thailandense]MCH5136819.1 GHKL domain-containing protein [Clostridiaceae bacterium UIB06]